MPLSSTLAMGCSGDSTPADQWIYFDVSPKYLLARGMSITVSKLPHKSSYCSLLYVEFEVLRFLFLDMKEVLDLGGGNVLFTPLSRLGPRMFLFRSSFLFILFFSFLLSLFLRCALNPILELKRLALSID